MVWGLALDRPHNGKWRQVSPWRFYLKIQINYQGREFLDRAYAELHKLAGTQQHITSAYHPQENGLVEQQNRTIKDALIKSLEEMATGLNAYQQFCMQNEQLNISWRHFIPFQILYNGQTALPVELQYNPTYKEWDSLGNDQSLSGKNLCYEGGAPA